EVPVAEDVGERLAVPAALDEPAAGRKLRLGEWALELRVEVDPSEAERVGEQPLRVEAWRLDALSLEERRRTAQHLAERHALRSSRSRAGGGGPPPRARR